MPYGLNDVQWENALEEAKEILADCAKHERTISYSELASQIRSARFDPASKAFAALLSEVSSQEFREGRGLLTVLVVHKGGDLKPGKGFFDLARTLGLKGDDETIWIEQFKLVTDFWRECDTSPS